MIRMEEDFRRERKARPMTNFSPFPFQAKRLESNDLAAIKVIKLEQGDDIQIIQQEIIMMRDCRHPNIIAYYGSYLRRDKLWICMEYCGGGSLQDIYQGERVRKGEEAFKFTIYSPSSFQSLVP